VNGIVVIARHALSSGGAVPEVFRLFDFTRI
jgi:hypothetical protein